MQRNDDGHGRQVDNYPTIHKMRQGGLPALPWHSDDKPFGMTQEDFDVLECETAHREEWEWLKVGASYE